MAEKKARNECFHCNERFHPGHRCKQGQFHRIELVPNHESLNSEEETEDEEVTPEEQPIISVHSLTGIPSHKTMILRGIIGHKRVNILMDSGSTHNFINEQCVVSNGLKMETLVSLGVSIADGQIIPIEGIIRDLDWKIHDKKFWDNIFVMKLGGCDMVLGVQWMDFLGDIVWNTKKSTMSFKYQGKKSTERSFSIAP